MPTKKSVEEKLGSFENPIEVDNFNDLWNVEFGKFVRIGNRIEMVSNELDRIYDENSVRTSTAAYTIIVEGNEATRCLYDINSKSFIPVIKRSYFKGSQKYDFYLNLLEKNKNAN
jgi:Fe-S oxidoreductase